MKSLQKAIGLILFLSLASCQAQEMNKKVPDVKVKEKLLGKINKAGLTQNSFATWFEHQHANYAVDKEALKVLKSELGNYDITAFMGTWCGDSKREVPRFYKVLEAAGYPMESLTMIAVDYVKPNYKKSPGGEEKGLNIIKVPTFIFYQDGKEVNRIIESPVVSLEQDMQAIVTGQKYVPNYSDMPVLPVD